MVPFKSGKTCNSLEPISNQDLISNLPDIAIDKIVKLLPLRIVAKMSILSRNWRRIWLSHKYLVFDNDFFSYQERMSKLSEENGDNETICNYIISNILFHHVGPVHEFNLSIPWHFDIECLNFSGWVSLLSKVGVKKIVMEYRDDLVPVPSYIYDCKDLVKLRIVIFGLNHPPSHFEGFAHLHTLDMFGVSIKYDVFKSLIANCPRPTVFKFVNWTDMDDLVIDMPNVESLTIDGVFDTIIFKNVSHLCFLSLTLDMFEDHTIKGVDQVIKMLASSCQLEDLHFGGGMCKYIGAGFITMSPALKFLQRLSLTDVDLGDFDQFYFTLGVVQCCPFLMELDIFVESRKCEVGHEFDYNKKCKLSYLFKVKIFGLTGSCPELQLIEYLLSIASNLEKFVLKCKIDIDPISELKVARNLLKLPRASPRAKLLCLEK